MISSLSNKELTSELTALRGVLNPFLNEHFKDVLDEAEKRLKGNKPGNKPVPVARVKTTQSKSSLKAKYYYARQK